MVSDISSPEDLLGIFPVQRGEDSVHLHDVHRPASLAVLEEVPEAASSSSVSASCSVFHFFDVLNCDRP